MEASLQRYVGVCRLSPSVSFGSFERSRVEMQRKMRNAPFFRFFFQSWVEISRETDRECELEPYGSLIAALRLGSVMYNTNAHGTFTHYIYCIRFARETPTGYREKSAQTERTIER
jgi:hypothetical protein